MGTIDISCSSSCSDVSDCLSMNFIGLGGGGGGTSHPQSFDLSYSDDEDPKVTVGEGYYMLGRAMYQIVGTTSLGNKSELSGTKYVVLNVSWSYSGGITEKVEVVSSLPRLTSVSAYVLLYRLYKGDIQLDCRNTCTIPLYE